MTAPRACACEVEHARSQFFAGQKKRATVSQTGQSRARSFRGLCLSLLVFHVGVLAIAVVSVAGMIGVIGVDIAIMVPGVAVRASDPGSVVVAVIVRHHGGVGRD
jgi:hypothetical protein